MFGLGTVEPVPKALRRVVQIIPLRSAVLDDSRNVCVQQVAVGGQASGGGFDLFEILCTPGVAFFERRARIVAQLTFRLRSEEK